MKTEKDVFENICMMIAATVCFAIFMQGCNENDRISLERFKLEQNPVTNTVERVVYVTNTVNVPYYRPMPYIIKTNYLVPIYQEPILVTNKSIKP